MPKIKSKVTKAVKLQNKTKKSVKKTVVARKAKAKTTTTVSKLSVPLFNIDGESQGNIVLPKEIFGQKPNKNLLAQTMRIYLSNQTAHWVSTKTRREVRGGGAKPHRQKGTGKARAGSIRSPLWVGGGVAHAPKYRKVKL